MRRDHRWAREGSSYLPRGMSRRRGRGRGTRDGLDVARIKISLHLCRAKRGWAGNVGEGRRVHGGAYLRVIPEGRTPSAWDPADNVSPLRAIPPAYTGCRSCRIDCTLRRDIPGKNVKVARIESGMLKGVLPQARLIHRSLVKWLLWREYNLYIVWYK